MQILFTEAALKIYNKALELNRRYFLKHSYTVGTDQIFLAFIETKHPLAEKFVAHFELDRSKVVKQVCQGVLPLSTEAVEQNARGFFEEVQKRTALQHAKITTEWDLFVSVFEMVTSVTVVSLLRDGFHYNEIKDFLYGEEMQALAADYKVDESELLPSPSVAPSHPPRNLPPPRKERLPSRPVAGAAEPAKNGSILAKFGRNLTHLAETQELPPVHFRDDVIQEMMEVLCRSQQRNVVLVGDPGIGKTAVVHGLARRLRQPDCPSRLHGRIVFQLNFASLLPGTRSRGSFEERVTQLVDETKAHREYLVFFEEFGHLFDNVEQEAALQILIPAFSSGDIQCIGNLVPESYRKKFEQNHQVAKYFSAIHIKPPSPEQSLEILAKMAPRMERYHKVKITPDAIRAAVEFSEAYLKSKVLPGKAVAVLDNAAARVSLATHIGDTVHREDVAEVVSREAQIPAARILATRIQSISQLEEFLKARIIGQDSAVRAVVDTIQVNRSGLGLRAQRPDGVFLLVGPTGVGKTELAKCVSEGLTNNANKLLRFDMSEFSEKHTVAKLIGSPPGYIGHEEEGQLTSGVRANPEAVILFDEIEKADPEVSKLFLQMFDDGRLTDSHGVTADFSQTIIFLTSNLGVKELDPGLLTELKGEERYSYLKDTLNRAIRGYFSPELINRLDDVLFLDFLTVEVINKIAEKRLSEVAQRVADRGTGVEITEGAFNLIVKEGYSPEFGARYLNRAIESLLLKPLAKFLLENEGAREVKIELSEMNTELTFRT
jgi:ATP-dependent Clp protease ATP-binding subunit ClpC